MKKIIFSLVQCFLWGATIFAQQPVPAKPQTTAIVLSNATIHIGNGKLLEKADLRFEKGQITAIGQNVDKNGAEVIASDGQHIYPGLILPCSQLGLVEIGALRPTRDNTETGEFNPNARALTSFFTDSDVIPVTRSNGILLVQATPEGGIVSGASSVMELDGWNWEDAAHTPDDALHINWIPTFTFSGFFSPNPGQTQRNEKRTEQLKELDNIFNQARAYAQSGGGNKNLKFEAMRGLFEGGKSLIIHVNSSKEIIESVQFAKKHQVKKIVIYGGSGALEVVDFLKENNIPVILGSTHRLPASDDEDVWHPYKLPALLVKSGLLVGLGYNEDPPRVRNLPFIAGTTAAYGLSKEEALMLVTGNNAKILGIDQKTGTLEVGKQANIVISTGDLLDMRSNNVTMAFIRGKKLDLTDKHKQLFKRYNDKYDAKN